jgi:GTP-binding protein
VSFRREAHVPRGGPDGGDGGRGGDVLLVCDGSLRDLRALKRRTHYRASHGGPGKGALRHGADGDPLLIRVPPGTQARGDDGAIASRQWDLVRDGERALLAAGGAGGRGNKRFTNARRQAPHFAERGLPGEEGWLALALKLLADVGLVGLPNAGKSSLIARLTRATPKVASYPFTTLEPVLGVLERDERQLVLADIPGLIEGASAGAGLGDEFLAHVERTRLLVHVLDLAPELSGAGVADTAGQSVPVTEDADPATPPRAALLANYDLIERELASHDERLAALPRVVALSKADLVAPERAERSASELSAHVGPEVPVIITSSATGVGVDPLARDLLSLVPPSGEGAGADEEAGGPASTADAEPALAEHMVFRPTGHAGYEVRRVDEHLFELAGERIERLLARFDLDNDEARAYVEATLQRLGVLGTLRSRGFEPGDEIRVAGERRALFTTGARSRAGRPN